MTKYKAVVPIGHPEKKGQPGWPAGAILTEKDLPAETIQKLRDGKLLVEYTEPAK